MYVYIYIYILYAIYIHTLYCIYIYFIYIYIKLQSGFVEISLLHCCSPVGLLHVCRASVLDNT